MISRNTKQKEILEKELEKTKTFFTAEEILEKTKTKDKRISLATIYRYLKEQTKKRNIHPYACNRKTIYSKQKRSHCHYTCEKTGKTTHFELENLDFLKHIQNKIPGTINSLQLEIRGICKEC